jgi:hypothetical protein
MRGYFGIGASVLAAAVANGCADRTVEQAAPVSAKVTTPSPCEAAIDAIGFRCSDGRTFSVRHDLNSACVVVFIDDDTFVLPRDAAHDVFTNGAVTLEQAGSTATLTGASATPLEYCSLMEQ